MYWHRGSMKTTAYPGSCHAEQTATAVESPGVIITMTDVSGRVRLNYRKKNASKCN